MVVKVIKKPVPQSSPELFGKVCFICPPEMNQWTPQIGITIDQPNDIKELYVSWENIQGKKPVKLGMRGKIITRYPNTFIPQARP